MKTMQEKAFARYVKAQKDDYRERPRAGVPIIDQYISKFTKKEKDATSPEDQMILALVSVL